MLKNTSRLCRIVDVLTDIVYNQRSVYNQPIRKSSNSMENEGPLKPQNNELEKLWRPRLWSKRFGPDEVYEEFTRIITLHSQRNRADIPCKLNVSYRDSKGILSNNETLKDLATSKDNLPKLDIFGTDLEPASPIFVYFHGGYWQAQSGELSSYAAGPLYTNNIVSVIVDYNLAPKVTVAQIVEESIDAMAWIVQYAVRNKSKSISICGHSCGAQLCAMILASPWFSQLPVEHKNLFKGVFLLAGVYDLRPLIQTTVNDPLSMSNDDAERNSPLLLLNAIVDNVLMRTPCTPLYVDMFVGENDAPAFIEQTQIFGEELKRHLKCKAPEGSTAQNISVKSSILPETDHFNLVENLANKSYELVERILNVING